MVQKTHNLLQTILKPLPLPNSPDGNLRFGDKVCILHIPTRSLVSAYMSTYAAHEATCLQPSSPLASSQSLVPCTRNMFVVNRCVQFRMILVDVFCIATINKLMLVMWSDMGRRLHCPL